MNTINNLTMIAAVGKNLELGKNNDLIWRLKGDMQFFKKSTMNKPIIMGMTTFGTLPSILEGRRHIVLTRKNLKIENVVIMHTKEEVLKFIKGYKDEVMIIGGASIYKEFLDYAKTLLLTEIDDECLDADTYFPSFDKNKYISTLLSDHKEKGIKYKHLKYVRK